MTQRFAVVDLEATGGSLNSNERIIQIGCVIIESQEIVHIFDTYINPDRQIPERIQKLTGIQQEDVATAPYFEEIAPLLHEMLSDTIFVAHNVMFDFNFLNEAFQHAGLSAIQTPAIDTVELTQILFPTLSSYHLSDICHALHIEMGQAHNALNDAIATSELLLKLIKKAKALPYLTLSQISNLSSKLTYQTGSVFQKILDLKEVNENNKDFVIYDDLLFKKRQTFPFKDEVNTPYPESKTEKIKLWGDQLEFRNEQALMMDQIYDYLNKVHPKNHLAIQIPPGYGKSLGYLLPSVLSSKQRKPLIISSYTLLLQEQLKEKVIPQLETLIGHKLVTVSLKSKRHYASLEKISTRLKELKSQDTASFAMMQVLVWLTETDTGDLDELNFGKYAEIDFWNKIRAYHDDFISLDWQPYEFLSRRQSDLLEADIILTNHSFLVHHFEDIFSWLQQNGVLVIDEAHRFPEFLHQNMRQSINMSGIQEQVSELISLTNILTEVALMNLHESLVNILFIHQTLMAEIKLSAQFIQELLISIQQKILVDNHQIMESLPMDLKRALTQLKNELIGICNKIDQLLDHLSENKQDHHHWSLDDFEYVEQWIKIGHALRDYQLFFKNFLQKSDRFEQMIQIDTEKEEIIFRSVQVKFSKEWLEQLAGIPYLIYTSGTLAYQGQVHYFERLVGDESIDFYDYSKELDKQYKAQIHCPMSRINPVKLGRDEYIKKAAHQIATLIGDDEYKVIILLGAIEDIEHMMTYLKSKDELFQYTILAQHFSGTNSRILKSFKQAKSAILIGTSAFFEGIDLPSDELQMVILPKLPFESPNELKVRMRHSIAELGGKNVFYADLLPQMMMRMEQAFGRLVRHESDRGVFVILDERYIESVYSHFLTHLFSNAEKFTDLSLQESKVQLAEFLQSDLSSED